MIPNCINTERLNVTESIKKCAVELREKYKDKVLCLAVGRHVPYKGMEYLVKSAAFLDDNFKICIGGNGPLTEQLKTIAKDDDKVEFLGRLSDKDLIAYFCLLYTCSINALDETDEDRERAEKGLISLQLRNYWIDNTHLNGYGYRAQAYAVYEKGIELGYWFANGGDVTSDSWVVVEDDVIQADYTGMASNEYGWWYFNDGTLDESYTGMAANEYGWWYMTNGALDLSYTGMASNEMCIRDRC